MDPWHCQGREGAITDRLWEGGGECEAEACSRVTDAHAVLMANGKAVTRRRFNSLCFNAFCRTGR